MRRLQSRKGRQQLGPQGRIRCQLGQPVHEQRVEAAGHEETTSEPRLLAIRAKEHAPQAGMPLQKEGRLRPGQRPEQQRMRRPVRQGRQRPAAGDEHSRRGAHEPLGQQGQAVVPGRVLAGPPRLPGNNGRLGLGLEVGLEIVEHNQDRLVLEGAQEIVSEPRQPRTPGELGSGIPVDGVGAAGFHLVMVAA